MEQALDEDELEQVAEQAEQLAETAMQLDAEGGAPSVSVEEPVEAGEASAMEEAQEVQGEA